MRPQCTIGSSKRRPEHIFFTPRGGEDLRYTQRATLRHCSNPCTLLPARHKRDEAVAEHARVHQGRAIFPERGFPDRGVGLRAAAVAEVPRQSHGAIHAYKACGTNQIKSTGISG